VIEENLTADPSSNILNCAKFTAGIAASIALKQYLENQKDSSEELKKEVFK